MLKPVTYTLLSLLLFGIAPLYGQRNLTVNNTDAPKRLALVIGNANYRHSSKLTNPVNDAEKMASSLKALGFEVILIKNADLQEMDTKLADFSKKLDNEGYPVGLFYYSGHGVQIDGKNYLVPVDANPQREVEVRYTCLEAQKVIDYMAGARVRTKILLLDACRNNPLPKSWTRNNGGGLAGMNAPEGTLIGFATAPGQVAYDGTGNNSPFTESLLEAMPTPGQSILDMMTQVNGLTKQKASDQGKIQSPYWTTNLAERFYFVPPNATPTPPVTTTPADQDRDGDGVPDNIDRCPDEPGRLDLRGCPQQAAAKASGPFSLAASAGLNISKFVEGEASTEEAESLTGFFAGISPRYHINDQFTVMVDVQYSPKGVRFPPSLADVRFRLHYLDFLPKVEYKFADNFGVVAGGNLGFTVYQEIYNGGFWYNLADDPDLPLIDKFDAGVLLGLNAYLNQIVFSVHYNRGLLNVDGPTISTSNFQLGVGYLFIK